MLKSQNLIYSKEKHTEIIEVFFEKNTYWNKDKWNIYELPLNIKEHKSITHPNFTFTLKNVKIKKELKYYLAFRLSQGSLSPSTLFEGISTGLRYISKFIDYYFPELNSIIEIDKEYFLFKYRNYLIKNGVKIEYINSRTGKKTITANIAAFSTLYDFYFEFYDDRKEIEKDIWNVKNLDVNYNEATNSSFKIDFNKIPIKFRDLMKKYIEIRVLTIQNLNFSTGRRYVKDLSRFFIFISQTYPRLNNFNHLNRGMIIEYIKYLRNGEILDLKTQKMKKTTDVYMRSNLSHLKKFLIDLQMFEWSEAPEKNIDILIYPDDAPYRARGINRKVKYIPDYIWDQVVQNINKLGSEYIPIILVMEASGFRISDVVSLEIDCIEKDKDGKWWLLGDQQKVKHKDHRVPISDEITKVIKAQQVFIKRHSTLNNNPKNYLFPRLKGQRKGKPIPTGVVNRNLNELAKATNIKDENGEIYHFRNHGFRHRYGVNLINNGMNIIHVQRLMAHASPEMTLVYAQIHDTTLRDEYFKARGKGAVRLSPKGDILEADIERQAVENNLELTWIRHNFDSLRMDHGICVKSPKVHCDFAEKSMEPPCIANNCRSFHVDSSFGDFYESQVKSLKQDIELYKSQGKMRSLEFAEKKLKNYAKILNGIEKNAGVKGMSKQRREYSESERKEKMPNGEF